MYIFNQALDGVIIPRLKLVISLGNNVECKKQKI